ncbi:MAG: precorrin-2 C(20)-methyltransferase [Rhodobacteraceae bacterium]|nr:precorrin-2 C(20)-methyltransferase [Paracoccaceae bacterium]MCY4196296.1 precorrin-2 C(20)-methyltransferase [Paracoccaceae bacterium]
MAQSDDHYPMALFPMTGTFIGVGLGPGDPELLTLKAARLIRTAPVIAYPQPENGESFTRSIAAEFIRGDVEEISISLPMEENRFPAQNVYRTAAKKIASRLDDGINVIALCQGDPFFYGSFMYLFAHLADAYKVDIVPGVPSLVGCAAAARQPLCARMESLTILPAPMPEEQLYEKLAGGGAMAIVKIGRHMEKIRRILTTLDLAEKALYCSYASMPHERIMKLQEGPRTAPYFSTILLPGRDPYGSR